MTDLDQLLADLRTQRQTLIQDLTHIDGRIQGIEEARAALAARAESVAVVSHEQARHLQRRPRRDIPALVKQTYDKMKEEGWNPSADQIARRIGRCSKSQVEAALKALDTSKSGQIYSIYSDAQYSKPIVGGEI
jgi:hypothetical protein